MGEQHTKWTLFSEPLDYLDGIQSGLTVKAENGAPVAYMFNHAHAVLATSAPDLLEVLKAVERQIRPLSGRSTNSDLHRLVCAAIAKATGTNDPSTNQSGENDNA